MFKPDSDTLITFEKVTFGYKPNKPILFDVSFSLKRKEYVCIVGANGCGKSTVAKMLVGLFKPWSGSIYFNNNEINKSNIIDLKKKSGIIMENPNNQFIGLTVQDDIAFGLENQCVEQKDMQSIIDKNAKYVGIFDLLKSSVESLSGGQKQLVTITSVLSMNPELIVFDEATSMLDNQSKKKINQLIDSLHTTQGKTIVSITHDMEEAAKADKIIVMNKGKVVLVGKPDEVFNNPQLEQLSLDKPFAYKFNQGVNYEK